MTTDSAERLAGSTRGRARGDGRGRRAGRGGIASADYARRDSYRMLTAMSQIAQGNATAECLTSIRHFVPWGGFDVRALIVILAAGIVTFVASFFGPAALAGKQPGQGGEPGVTRGDLRGVNFV